LVDFRLDDGAVDGALSDLLDADGYRSVVTE